MESEQPVASVNKPSGIPRASKLPILSSKTSRASLQENIEPAKATNAATRIQKQPSISSFSRFGQPASKLQPVNNNHLISRNDLEKPSDYKTKHLVSSSKSRLPGSRVRAAASTQSVPDRTEHLTNSENQGDQDGPGPLDIVRTTSRQSSTTEASTAIPEVQDGDNLSKSPSKTRASRPSLSDRTMESIQKLPSTPKERRRSSFFSPVASPMGPPPRPGSSLSRNGGNDADGPTTSEGQFPKPIGRPSTVKRAPVSVKSTTMPPSGDLKSTPVNPHRRSVSSNLASKLQSHQSSASQTSHPLLPTTPSASDKAAVQRAMKATPMSKTLAARPTKVRPSLSDASGPAVQQSSTKPRRSGQVNRSTPNEVTGDAPQSATKPSQNSSAALREQIAAAKAAARKERAKHDSPQSVSMASDGHFENDVYADPFNLAPKDGKHILRNRINAARMDGKLNIGALGLKEIPNEVLKMYDAAAMEESKVSWAEVVDLTRLNAADNEIEEVGDSVFPDKSADDFDMDGQAEGNQFGGLEMLNLHGNRLQALPIGLRRLERLTSLNLTHNKLENSALEIILQVTSIKDLRLGHNVLTGTLSSSITDLKHLERLELQSNRLLGLPEAVRELVGLRVLNVAANQLTTVPMEALQEIPLNELDLSSNALISSMFPLGGPSRHSTLQILNVANNSLAAITFDEVIDLPQLHTLDVTNNHLTGLPPASGFPGLVTLTAADNKITDLPADFSSLRKLRNVNLSSNELRLLDPQIANMDSLESLLLASNPLRDKKFLTLNAADIKRDLKARLMPSDADNAEPHQENEGTADDEAVLSRPLSSPSASWSLKANATLDLAGKRYSDSINDSLGSFLRSNEIKHLLLQSNVLTAVPPALWLGQDLRTLDLSNNSFSTYYVYDELELPALQELNLSNCGLQNLEPLVSQINAPNLQALNVSANRLSGAFPPLRTFFPRLTTILSNDNRFLSITADSLRELHVVNLANNSIEQLPAEVGLLWNEGLRNLEIGGNAFRMPNYRILEKGTEATMRWLRDRLPESQAIAGAGSGSDPVTVGVSQ